MKRQKKIVCLKVKPCRFFKISIGRLWPNEAREDLPIYFCAIGQFKITHNICRIPLKCKVKNLGKRR